MKKQILVAVCAMGLAVSGVWADSASFGGRLGYATWKDSKLEDVDSQSGLQFGPTFLYRFGTGDAWAFGLDARHGSMDRLERSDLDATLHYSVSSMFSVFAEARYVRYKLDGEEETAYEEDIKTNGPGIGGGISVVVPLGYSGFFLAANTRLATMQLDTDIPDASGNSFSWGYEGALAYSFTFDAVERGSLFMSLGYRHQEMRGGGLGERLQMPFAEFGFTQRF